LPATGEPAGGTSPGASGLTYDASADQYTYVWKTDRGWAGTCHQLVVKFTTGEVRRATFRFER
jgi:hypothetical protein